MIPHGLKRSSSTEFYVLDDKRARTSWFSGDIDYGSRYDAPSPAGEGHVIELSSADESPVDRVGLSLREEYD